MEFRRWHLVLVPVPIIGWLLLLAILLDGRDGNRTTRAGEANAAVASGRSRCAAASIDLAVVVALWAAPPPALGWLLASLYLLFRDAGRRPLGLGKRLLGLRVEGPGGRAAGYVDSFDRNLTLLVPYLGAFVELVLLLSGRRRLGDRLAAARVLAPPSLSNS